MYGRNALAAVMAILLALFATIAPAHAEETTCRGTLNRVTVDNLRVPQGATCKLNGTTVQGTVKVENNAKLYASGVRVVGNVQAEGAAYVEVKGGSTVGGSIQIKQGGGAKIDSVRITGDLQFDANTKALTANKNTINGSLQAFSNRGGLSITSNTIDGNLQCKSNDPAPRGGRNIVGGNKEDQCARL